MTRIFALLMLLLAALLPFQAAAVEPGGSNFFSIGSPTNYFLCHYSEAGVRAQVQSNLQAMRAAGQEKISLPIWVAAWTPAGNVCYSDGYRDFSNVAGEPSGQRLANLKDAVTDIRNAGFGELFVRIMWEGNTNPGNWSSQHWTDNDKNRVWQNDWMFLASVRYNVDAIAAGSQLAVTYDLGGELLGCSPSSPNAPPACTSSVPNSWGACSSRCQSRFGPDAPSCDLYGTSQCPSNDPTAQAEVNAANWTDLREFVWGLWNNYAYVYRNALNTVGFSAAVDQYAHGIFIMIDMLQHSGVVPPQVAIDTYSTYIAGDLLALRSDLGNVGYPNLPVVVMETDYNSLSSMNQIMAGSGGIALRTIMQWQVNAWNSPSFWAGFPHYNFNYFAQGGGVSSWGWGYTNNWAAWFSAYGQGAGTYLVTSDGLYSAESLPDGLGRYSAQDSSMYFPSPYTYGTFQPAFTLSPPAPYSNEEHHDYCHAPGFPPLQVRLVNPTAHTVSSVTNMQLVQGYCGQPW